MSQKKYYTTYVDVKFNFWSIGGGFGTIGVLWDSEINGFRFSHYFI